MGGEVSWSRDKDTFFLHIFLRWVRKWHLFLAYTSQFFTNLKKNFFKKLLFSSKITHVESISFNWHLFRNTHLTYHNEMWKRRMYLAYEIIFEFSLAYFILFFGHFWPKQLFGFKKKKFLCVYNGYCL